MAAACVAAGLARAEQPAPQVVRQFPLDEHIVYQIPIGKDVPTTLMFPSALTAIEGADVSASPDTPAPVLLSYTPGRYFFSVRAQTDNARAAVNVVWHDRTFVIHFFTSPTPCGSVTFYEDDTAASEEGGGQHRPVTPDVLLNLLDEAKGFALLQAQHPEALRAVEHTTPGDVTLYKDFKVTVEEVFRFEAEDTFVFKLRLESTGSSEVVYQPQRLAARIGDHVYYASIADASGIIPPKTTTLAYFAITGVAVGGRGGLSIKNRFNIIVPRVERDAKLVVPE